jgi:hypothetical protein
VTGWPRSTTGAAPTLKRMANTMTNEERLSEARRVCPDGYMVVPRQASSIMALRGSQASVGWADPYMDRAGEYFKFDEAGECPAQDALAPKDRFDYDEREYWLVAAIWDGCIAGLDEWQRRWEVGKCDPEFLKSWERPYLETHRHLIASTNGQLAQTKQEGDQ